MKKNNFNGDDEVRPRRRYDGFTVTEAPVIERRDLILLHLII